MPPPGVVAPLRQYAAGSAMQGRPVTEDTPPDLLEGTMDLTVILPSRRRVRVTVYRSTPMMDLLIQVTTAHRISPGGHVIHVVSDARPIAYKPSTPIGTLDATILEIVPKNRVNDAKNDSNISNSTGESCQRLKMQEWVYKQQLVVNLPRQQLAVYRVSPHTSLADALQLVCTDRDYDASTVQLRRPDKPEEELDPEQTLHDLDLHEVSLVPRDYSGPPPPLSVSDLLAMSSLAHPHDGDQRSKRKSVFKFFSRKSKSSTGDSSLSSGSAGERSVSPTRSDESGGAETPCAITRTTSEHHLAQVHHTSRSNGGPRPISMMERPLDDHSPAAVRSGLTNRSSSNINVSTNNRSNASHVTENGRPASVVPPLRTKKRKAPPAPPLLQQQEDSKGADTVSCSPSRRSSGASAALDATDCHSIRSSPPTSELSGTDTVNSSVPPSGAQAAPRNRRRAPVPPKNEAPRPSAIPEESSNSKPTHAPIPDKAPATPGKTSVVQNETENRRSPAVQKASTNGTDHVGNHTSMNGVHHVEVHASAENSTVESKQLLNSSIDSNSSHKSSEVSEESGSTKTHLVNNTLSSNHASSADSKSSSAEADKSVPKSSQAVSSHNVDTVDKSTLPPANSIVAENASTGGVASPVPSERSISPDQPSAATTSAEDRDKIKEVSAQELPATAENLTGGAVNTTNDASVDVQSSVVPISPSKSPSVEPAVDVAVDSRSPASVAAAPTSG